MPKLDIPGRFMYPDPPAKGAPAKGAQGQGIKADDGKLRYCLTDPRADREVAAVLTFGATRYDVDGWRTVPDARVRYSEALRRHHEAFRLGEVLDPQTELHHLAHLICCAHFLLALELESLEEGMGSLAEAQRMFEGRFAHAMKVARELRAERTAKEAAKKDLDKLVR